MPNPIVNRRVVVSGGYDASAAAYFARLEGNVTPQVKTLVNNLVVTLKADNNWPYIDHLPLMNMPNEQNAMVNLKSPSDPLMVNYNSCVHTPYIGIQGNGTTSYIDTNYNPSTYGGNLTLNSALFGVYSNTNATNIANYGANTAAHSFYFIPKFIDNNFYTCNNTTIDNNAPVAITSSDGLLVMSRTASNNTNVYRNGVTIGTTSTASSAIPNQKLYLLSLNNNGTAITFDTRQLAISIIGNSQINPATFNDAITEFVNAMAAL